MMGEPMIKAGGCNRWGRDKTCEKRQNSPSLVKLQEPSIVDYYEVQLLWTPVPVMDENGKIKIMYFPPQSNYDNKGQANG